MLRLERTEIALSELDANSGPLFGEHAAARIRAGALGQNVAEVPFDPRVHDPAMINPLSVWQAVTGDSHVRLVRPEQPLRANVVVHETGAPDGLGVNPAKRRLSESLQRALEESLPGMTDHLYSYYIGPNPADIDGDTEALDYSDDPMRISRSVAEVCAHGLSFVISDFNYLPLGEQDSKYFPATVAVKVNHPLEMGLSPNQGIIRVHGAGEVNTHNTQELNAFNETLSQYHRGVSSRLEQAGIAVAQVLFDPGRNASTAFNGPQTDRAIATAITHIAAAQA